jgi:EAL domain-containing protein (putative c-di-GMP-specific phosphodiesterase class I)
VLIGDAESTERELHDLKRLGIQLAVDDFGTGYSSLSYLRQLPVDIVKIDKAFIDRISDDPTDLALVGGIVKLAETLHLATVAEGVESAAQVGALHDVGCDLIQGFVYAKPEPADKVLALIDFEHDPRWAHLV